MPTDDEAARKARAERLRKQIEQTGSEPAAETEADPHASRPKSPRELIEEKMKELDKNRGGLT